MKKKLDVKCPHCKTQFNYYESEFRPFCCEKCKMIDMGQWLTEGYQLKGRDYSLYEEDPEKIEEILRNETPDEF